MNDLTKRDEEIFDAARQIADPLARADFLNRECGEDETMRKRIEGLLHCMAEADDFFRPLRPISDWDEPALASEEIPRYQLFEKIGEGGCGVVYVAQQIEPIKRLVAIKLIKPGLDSRQVVLRFEGERQALALMDHPNIARIFDAGETATGRPFFVMELARGVPITKYFEENRLSLRERLVLFIEVCHAVQHAHQKGLIHRDIKPSNVLVALTDGRPVSKIIDFGIAKATQQKLSSETIQTQLHLFMGTPAYISPEQADLSSADVDTRSDIYSLGALLYEALTGKTPFDGKALLASGLDEMRRVIREKDPPRPSTVLSQVAEAGERIDTDLDWVVMKCLEKDRDRRYQTAADLAADLERYLKQEAVLARSPSSSYRLRKFIRRHKLEAVATLFAVISLLAAAGISLWKAREAQRSAIAAAEQAETARTIKDFLLQQLLGQMHPYTTPAYDPANRILLERIARAIEGRFPNHPLVEAEVRFALAEGFDSFDDFARAAEEYQRSFDIRKSKLGIDHSDSLRTAAALALENYEIGRQKAAEEILDEAINVVRKPPGIQSRGAAEVFHARASRRILERRVAEAMPFLQESLQLFTKTLGPDHVKVTEVLWNFAVATSYGGDFNRAERLWTDGVERSVKLHGADHPWVGFFLKSHANALIERGRFDEAATKLERACALLKKSLGPDHTLTLETELSVAELLEKQGHIELSSERFADLHRRWTGHLPSERARQKCNEIAAFFVRHPRTTEAKAADEKLLPASDLKAP